MVLLMPTSITHGVTVKVEAPIVNQDPYPTCRVHYFQPRLDQISNPLSLELGVSFVLSKVRTKKVIMTHVPK